MEPVRAQKVDDIWADNLPAGSFAFADDGVEPYNSIEYICPCGCGELMTLPISTGEKKERYWQWDGNRETPTLSPSIRRLDGCKFHGFLQNGIWTGNNE